MAYGGKYQVKNKSKYRGNAAKVQYRSLWELHVMKWLDANENIKWWQSEETVIPYFSEADQKKRRYFMDFTVCFNDGTIHLWEVKPHKETQPPKPPKRMTSAAKNRYLGEIHTWQTNLSKWTTTKQLCDKKNWVFKILTEHALKKNFGMKV